MPKIIISPFCQKQKDCCLLPLESLLPEILANFAQAKPSHREGILIVSLDPKNFVGQIRTLQEGDILQGEYKRRCATETPRKEIRVPHVPADPLVAVDAILYSRETLAENSENSDTSADYEVITILTKVSNELQPMPPETLMANHFLDSGGTATNLTPEQFVNELRKSYNFWRNKAITA